MQAKAWLGFHGPFCMPARITRSARFEASDRSTAQLMDTLYQGLESGDTPGVALRRAKLAMLHAPGSFSKPFYWAAFQMYSRL